MNDKEIVTICVTAAHHLIRVEASLSPVGSGESNRIDLGVMSVPDAHTLVRSLSQAIESASRTIVGNAMVGECDTCDNSHMVQGKNGDEYCPDCTSMRHAAPPTRASVREIERWVHNTGGLL